VENVELLEGFAGLFDEQNKLLSCTKYTKQKTQSLLSEIMDHKKIENMKMIIRWILV